MDLFSTVSTTLRCRGKILARMRAASVDVDLKSRPMANANFRAAITRFLRMAEAQTEQLKSIVGITVDLYKREIALRERPQDNRQHFRMRNKSFFFRGAFVCYMCVPTEFIVNGKTKVQARACDRGT